MIGLSTALVLSKHKNFNVTVVSKHMPGDYDIEYASPWAGANFMPVGKEGSKLRVFERATWPEIDRICRELPEAGVHYQECRVYGRKKDEGTAVGIWFQELMKEDPWFKDLMPEVSPGSVPSHNPFDEHILVLRREHACRSDDDHEVTTTSSASSTNPSSHHPATPAQASNPSASTPPSTSPGSQANVSKTT